MPTALEGNVHDFSLGRVPQLTLKPNFQVPRGRRCPSRKVIDMYEGTQTQTQTHCL